MSHSDAARPAPPQIPDHELLEPIGRGSYGEVWRARTVLGVERAVKIVRREAFEDERPFDREFAGITRYEPISRSHEGLVHVLHAGLAPDGSHFYYSMELADDATALSANATEDSRATTENARPTRLPYRAATLGTLLKRNGPLPVERCLDIALQLAGALRHLHAEGLVHRDIKPSNVILVKGRIKLADLGLVTAFGESRSLVGTEGYLAPEGGGTRQADLFSLGRVIYEMATGNDRLDFPNLPSWWLDHPERARLMEFNEIFARACAQDPAQRYADASQMLGDLAMIQGGRSVRRLRQVERRLQLAARAAFGIAVAGCVALAAFALQHRQARHERELRERVEQAEREARRQLYEAEKARARAEIQSGAMGRRASALAAVGRATAATPSLDLRNLAIAAWSLPDLRAVKPSATGHHTNATYVLGSPDGTSLVRAGPDGTIERVDLFSGAIRRWPPPSRADDDRRSGRLLRWTSGVFGGVEEGWVALRGERSGGWIADVSRAELLPVPMTAGADWLSWSSIPGAEDCVLGFKDRRLGVFNVASNAVVRFIDTGVVPSWMASSPDGRWLAISDSREIDILAWPEGVSRSRIAMPDYLRRLTWSPDARRLATSHSNFEINVWDRETGRVLANLRGHNNQILALAFLGGGSWLGSSGWDGTLRLWDVFSGREVARHSLSAEWIGQARSGGRVAVRQGSKRLEWFEFDPPQQPVRAVCLEARGAPHPRAIAIHPAGRWFAVASEEGVPLFDIETAREVAHLEPPGSRKMFRVMFEPDGRGLIASGPGACVRWPVTMEASGELTFGESATYAPGNRLGDSVLGADGKLFAISHDGSSIHVRGAEGTWRRIPCDGTLHSLDLSADGRWLAAGTHHSGWARVWDARTGERVHEFTCAPGVTPRFTPDGRFLMTCSGEEFRLWNLETGQPEKAWARPSDTGLRGKADWPADGRIVAITRSRTQVDLLEGFTDRVLCSLPDGDWEITCLAFDAAGRRLIVGRDSGELQIWDIPKLREDLRGLKLDWNDSPPAAGQ